MRACFILAACLVACSSSSSSPDGGTPSGGADTQPSDLVVLSPSIDTLIVEVDYQTNAAPYTGAGGATLTDVWQVTQDNLTRVFQKSPKTLTLPHTLDQMEELTDITGTTFTTDQILAIATAHRDTKNSGTTASYYVVFLDGYLSDSGGTEMDVIGVSIGNTGVVAMFKPVITSTNSGLGNVSKYVEQSTLVHELGHSVGLVNNGIPLTSQHQDTAHGAHCTNTSCAMYWENEGASSAVAFAKQAFLTGSTVIYGAECLADIDAVAH